MPAVFLHVMPRESAFEDEISDVSPHHSLYDLDPEEPRLNDEMIASLDAQTKIETERGEPIHYL